MTLRKSLTLLLIIITLNLHSIKPDADFSLSWIKKGLIACGVGTGYYLYSSYEPAPLSDCYHALEEDTSGPITIFVHGYEATYRQAYKYVDSISTDEKVYHNQYRIITTPSLVTFNFADAGKEILRVNRKETSMAQKSEIERLRTVVEKVKQEHPDQDIILMGLSRGASTIINLLATYPDIKVKAVVLESPFGHLGDVINNLIRKIGWEKIPGIQKIGMAIAKCLFPQFSIHGIHPIDVVDKLPQDLPILIVASLEDQLVPTSSSKSLHDKLVETGHSNAYFLLINHGKHAKIITDQDGQQYEEGVHTFYKKFGLPHSRSKRAKEKWVCHTQTA